MIEGRVVTVWELGSSCCSASSLLSSVVCLVPSSSLRAPFISAMTLPCLGIRTAYAVPFPPAEAARLRRSLQVDRLNQFRPLLGPMIGARSYSLLSCGSLPL
jgi:hypothetical protein